MHREGASTMVAFTRFQTSHDRQMLGASCQLWQVLADQQARRFGGDRLNRSAVRMPRLQIECIGLRRTAVHPQEDAMASILVGLGWSRLGCGSQSGHPTAHSVAGET